MGIPKIKFGAILTMLATAMVLGSACGPGAGQPPTQPGPGGNQAPVISSLTSAQMQVYPLSITELRRDAKDPDGDAINYEWSCTGGKFSGTGTPVVSWIAPEKLGDYDIKVTVTDDKGGITQETMTLSVVTNFDPEIMSLDASPDIVLPNGKSTIICVAKDPDSAELEYSWSATDGSITGVGDTVTWTAPDKEGEFTISVIVNDGKGGQNTESVSITARQAIKTVTLNLLRNETGNVSSTKDKDTSKMVAGDDDRNVGYRAFFGFDVSQLKGTDVKDAKLTFTTGEVPGKPFDKSKGLGGLSLYRVRGEQGRLPDYDTTQYKLAKRASAAVMWEPPTVVDVTREVESALITSEYSIHLQFEASFRDQTKADHANDYIRWTVVTLTVTYAEK